MTGEDMFIPKILLCGDLEEFFARIGQRPVRLLGIIQFFGEVDGQEFNFLHDGKFLFDDKLSGRAELLKMIREEVDYLVFNDVKELHKVNTFLGELGCPRSQIITALELKNLPTDNFYDNYSDLQLMMVLENLSVKTLLDMNAHFVKSLLLTKEPNKVTQIDCICNEPFWAIKEEGIYRKVYNNFSECALKHYDAVLISRNSKVGFDNDSFLTESVSDMVITFARNGSEVDKYLGSRQTKFAKVAALPSLAGKWFFCFRRTPPVNFTMYVVAHKALPSECIQYLPEGYRIIHAGHALTKEDFGWIGDDTGDNISHLNPYINEQTALYRMWKNTSDSILGLSHYRRFFTPDGKTFLTEAAALNILRD